MSMAESGVTCEATVWQLPGQSPQKCWEGVSGCCVAWFSTSTVKFFYINKNCEYIHPSFKYSPFLFLKTTGFMCSEWHGANTG